MSQVCLTLAYDVAPRKWQTTTTSNHQKLSSLYSESEIHIVTPFEDKLCFLPASSCLLPPPLTVPLPLPIPTHVAWPHLAKREIADEYKHTNGCLRKPACRALCVLRLIFCIIAVDLFSLHTRAHRAQRDDCCFSHPVRHTTIYIVKNLHKIVETERIWLSETT